MDRQPCQTGDRLRRALLLEAGACALLVVVALVIGTYNLEGSGPLWPDGPRYANAAAMIHDWLRSGDLTRPYDFAKKDYSQYPAFNLPYHPPAYPGALGVLFLLTGASYPAARAFVALTAGACGCFVYAFGRRLGVGRLAACAAGLLLLTTPEIAHWSRDTMSDVPGLAAALAATWLFLRWLDSGKGLHGWLAFGAALAAFLTRLPTAGVVPAWFLYALWRGQGGRLRSWSIVLPSLLYLGLAAGWVAFAARFNRYEVAAHGKLQPLSSHNLSYFPTCLPALVACGSFLPGVAGAAWAPRLGRRCPAGLLWLSWLISYTLFKLAMPTSHETRHFLTGLASFAGLSVCLWDAHNPALLRRVAGPLLVVAGLGVNLVQLGQLPRGMVGYEEVAREVARLERPGNVLLACWEDQDFIFRYRACSPAVPRRMVRADRSLAIRLPQYARVPATIQARTEADVLGFIERGRVRYLITCSSEPESGPRRDEEMELLHRVASSGGDKFRLLWEGGLLYEPWKPARHGRLFLWEYQGELPEGPSELPVLIPTAGMELSSGL
jgi:hypothetical protein